MRATREGPTGGDPDMAASFHFSTSRGCGKQFSYVTREVHEIRTLIPILAELSRELALRRILWFNVFLVFGDTGTYCRTNLCHPHSYHPHGGHRRS